MYFLGGALAYTCQTNDDFGIMVNRIPGSDLEFSLQAGNGDNELKPSAGK